MLPHSSGPETFLNHHGWLFCSLPKKDDHDNRRRSNPDHVHAFQTATLLVSQPSPMMSAKDPLHANLGQSGLAQSNGAVRAFWLANPLRIPPPPRNAWTQMQKFPVGMTPHSAGNRQKFRPALAILSIDLSTVLTTVLKVLCAVLIADLTVALISVLKILSD